MTGQSRFFSNLHVLPHPAAPLFTTPEPAKLLLSQLITEMSSANPQLTHEVLDLLRQASLVNLYFFIKYVLGAYGDYAYLNDGLQLDLCNWLQSPTCKTPGAHWALCMFRGAGKTDIATVGDLTWGLWRNPDKTYIIVNATRERATDKMSGPVLANFQHNELLRLLNPAACAFPKQTSSRAFKMPNVSKYRKEWSVLAMGITGSTEGDRADEINFDDIIGLDDLSPENMSSASMETKKRNFQLMLKANIRNQESIRRANLTPFGAESVYSQIFENIGGTQGYHELCNDPLYKLGGSKLWHLYLRDVNEDGVDTVPEVQTIESLEDLRRDNPVIYFSQYRMRPQEGGLLEFKDLPVGRAKLLWTQDKEGRNFNFRLVYPASEKRRLAELVAAKQGVEPEWDLEKDEVLALEDLSHAVTLDPAGTEAREATSKSSKSSLVHWTRDWLGRNCLCAERTGFYAIQEVFNKIQELVLFYGGLIPWVGIEKAAMQKIIRPLLEKERSLYWDEGFVGLRDLDAGGDKIGRIRWTLAPAAARGLLWVCEGTGQNFLDEWGLFPMGKKKIDALDASEKALRYLGTPEKPGAGYDEDDLAAAPSYVGVSPVTGY